MAIQKSTIQSVAKKGRYAADLLVQSEVAMREFMAEYNSGGSFGGDGASLLDAQFATVDDSEGKIAETGAPGVSRNDLILWYGTCAAFQNFLDNVAVPAGDRRTILHNVSS